MSGIVLEPRVLPARFGWRWIVSGFELFRRAPLAWTSLVLVFLLLLVTMTYVPFVGPMLFILLYPVFFAGFMHGCAALDSGRELDIAHLFSGFRGRAAALVSLGGMNLVAQIVIAGILVATVGDRLGAMERGADTNDPAAALAWLQQLSLPMAFYLLLSLPLVMAMWFAPTLLAFHDVKPLAAARASFRACLVNVGAFAVYGATHLALLLLVTPTVVWVVTALLSPLIGSGLGTQILLSVMLGAVALILFVTMVASNYAGYRDVFESASDSRLPVESA